MTEHPMQPIEVDDRGVPRFKINKAVDYLLEHGGIDLNELYMQVRRGTIPEDDYMHLMQLIGYSVSGYGDLAYSDDRPAWQASADAADTIANRLHRMESHPMTDPCADVHQYGCPHRPRSGTTDRDHLKQRQAPAEGFPCPSCGRPGVITHYTVNTNRQEMTISHPYTGGMPGQGPTDPCHLDDAASREFIRSWPEQ